MDIVYDINLYNPWIDNLNYDWDPIIRNSTSVQYEKNTIIFHQFENANNIYVIKKGRVRLYLMSSNGEEKALVIIGENGLIGECSLNEQNHYSSSAIAVSDVVLYKLGKTDFIKIISNDFKLAQQVIELNNQKFRSLSMQAMHLSYTNALQRICAALIQLSIKYGTFLDEKRVQLSISFTHQELAELVGKTRVTVAQNIKYLEKENYLKKLNKSYIINDIDRLAEIVESG